MEEVTNFTIGLFLSIAFLVSINLDNSLSIAESEVESVKENYQTDDTDFDDSLDEKTIAIQKLATQPNPKSAPVPKKGVCDIISPTGETSPISKKECIADGGKWKEI